MPVERNEQNQVKTSVDLGNGGTLEYGRTYFGFKAYRGVDVKVGKGGYVKVNVKGLGDVWATANERFESEIKMLGGGKYSVTLLGWGESPVFELSDFTEEEQARLKETL